MARKLYLVISDYHRESFEETIQNYLAAGWELQGGVSAHINCSGLVHLNQALVKDEQDSPTKDPT